MEIQRNTYDYQVQRALKRKIYLINLRNGRCEICGYDKNLAAMEFHHIDPLAKETRLDSRHLSNSTMEKILLEFEILNIEIQQDSDLQEMVSYIRDRKINKIL